MSTTSLRKAGPSRPEAAQALIKQAKLNRRKAKIVGSITVFVFVAALAGRVNSTNAGEGVAYGLGQIIGAGLAFALIAYAVQLRRRNPEGVLQAEIAGRLATRAPTPVSPQARKQPRRMRRTRALATFSRAGWPRS